MQICWQVHRNLFPETHKLKAVDFLANHQLDLFLLVVQTKHRLQRSGSLEKVFTKRVITYNRTVFGPTVGKNSRLSSFCWGACLHEIRIGLLTKRLRLDKY